MIFYWNLEFLQISICACKILILHHSLYFISTELRTTAEISFYQFFNVTSSILSKITFNLLSLLHFLPQLYFDLLLALLLTFRPHLRIFKHTLLQQFLNDLSPPLKCHRIDITPHFEAIVVLNRFQTQSLSSIQYSRLLQTFLLLDRLNDACGVKFKAVHGKLKAHVTVLRVVTPSYKN